uniref:Integrase n=1 Tax=Steinernema glaseri TaxID=37863 RepID=A0A1I7ZLS3_9BILA
MKDAHAMAPRGPTALLPRVDRNSTKAL